MKILWIHDFTLRESNKNYYQGGAQITNLMIMDEGEKRGHNIGEMCPDEIQYDKVKKWEPELIITNNISRFKPEDIEWLHNNFPCIRYEHDFGFCKKRDGNCDQHGGPCKNEFFETIFKKSIHTIFLSPLQYKIHKASMDFLEEGKNVTIIPSPIDIDLFRNKEIKRKKNTYIYFGEIWENKGVPEMLDYARTHIGIFHFAGRPSSHPLINQINQQFNCAYLNEVPHAFVPMHLQKYENFMAMQKWVEAFGRAVMEAKVSGCNILTGPTTRIGALSFDCTDNELIEQCRNAPKTFWETIEAVVEEQKWEKKIKK